MSRFIVKTPVILVKGFVNSLLIDVHNEFQQHFCVHLNWREMFCGLLQGRTLEVLLIILILTKTANSL